LPGGYLLVNATPVGMHPKEDESPLEPRDIARYQAVADLIYNPPQTLLLRHAATLGLPNTDGLAMLAAQAVAAQGIWQHRRFDETLERAVLRRLRALQEATP
jgi:shikimate dehydrogenase